MSGQFLDIILFAVVAIFLIMRLKNILGSEKGKIINIKTARAGILKPKSKTNTADTNPDNAFLEGANQAFSMIVEAYQSSNISKVEQLLTPEALKIFNENKSPSNIKFMNIKSSKLIASSEPDTKFVRLVGFVSEHYDVKTNELITVSEEWGFEKDKNSKDPNWKLFSIKVVS